MELLDKYCVFAGDSATGKTYMTDFIKIHCIHNSIPYAYINYETSKNLAISSIRSISNEESVIIIDNTEVIMCDEIEEAVYITPGYKVIMIRDFFRMPYLSYFKPGLYKIKREGRMLVTKKVGQL